jgi:TPR repeat protein
LKPPRVAASSGEVDAPTARVTLAAHHNPLNRNSGLPAARTATMDGAPAGARRAAGDGTETAGATQQPPPPADAVEIAARLKLGVDLMAAGDIAAARTMFARVAEAGDVAGAFALAETYDPAVLGTMRLRGGITPDPAQARRWYEAARDMGSGTAQERITRLTGR